MKIYFVFVTTFPLYFYQLSTLCMILYFQVGIVSLFRPRCLFFLASPLLSMMATYTMCKLLLLGMAWERGVTPYIGLHSPYGVAMCPLSILFYNSRVSPSLSYQTNIYLLQNISHFTMKHDNYDSYMLFTLLKPSYLAMMLSLCIAKLPCHVCIAYFNKYDAIQSHFDNVVNDKISVSWWS